MNIYIHTFGCKLNINESENIKSRLIELSYHFTTDFEKAECFIINTCTVTKQSDEKVEKYLLKIKNDLSINASCPIFLIGCYVSKKSYINNDKNTIIIKNEEKDNAANIIDNYLKENYKCHIENRDTKNQEISCSENTYNENNDSEEKSRYFLKIQDGCNVFCTYCIVAFVRGRARSVAPSVIIENINRARSLGYREIVFTGINIASYMYEGINFEMLIEEHILDIIEKNNMRLRISSIEPFLFTDKLISLFANESICPHIHIPLQSASDKILQLMNRRYDKALYKSIVDKIRLINRDILITSDVMVGFPGEDESDFNETVDLADYVKFFKMHIFRYSKREGTKAYLHENQVGYRTKIKRAKILNDINSEMHKYFINQFNNKILDVIIEKKIDSGQYFGTSGQYLKAKVIDAPENIDKKMLISGQCLGTENNMLIVKYQKIL